MAKRSMQGAGERARKLAQIAEKLDERKKQLVYGEFERWARKAYPQYPIQVLRYLRKAHRVFGGELPRLLERHGQKKVFLLLGLDDPWAPLRDGISVAGKHGVHLTELSVSQLRSAIRQVPRATRGGATGWGGVAVAMERWATIWPRLKRMPLSSVVERTSGARQQLERFRALLREAVVHLDEVLSVPRRKPSRESSSFLD